MLQLFSRLKFGLEEGAFSGLAVPYNEITGDFRKIEFAEGSLADEDGKTFDTLYEHKNEFMVGSALASEDHTEGLSITGKIFIADDDHNMKAKEIHAHSTRNGYEFGLSIGVKKIIKFKELKKKFIVEKANLNEISIVRRPAFKSAKINHLMSEIKEGDFSDVISIARLRSAIKETKDQRDFERVLHRDCGLSQKSAVFLASIVRAESTETVGQFDALLAGIKAVKEGAV